VETKSICLVCGYPDQRKGGDAICECCGFFFDIDDYDWGIRYEEWRREWIASGMMWSSGAVSPPDKWNAADQLKNLRRLQEEPDESLHETGNQQDSSGVRHVCAVCGYRGLIAGHHGEDGCGSGEFCPSCGFRFGNHDERPGIAWAEWRGEWVSRGCPWFAPNEFPPPHWSPVEQLQCLRQGEGRKRRSSREMFAQAGSSEQPFVCANCGLRDVVWGDSPGGEGCSRSSRQSCGYRLVFENDVGAARYERSRRDWVARGMPLFGTYAKADLDWATMRRVADALRRNSEGCQPRGCSPLGDTQTGGGSVCPVCWFPAVIVELCGRGDATRESWCPSCGYECGFHEMTCGIGVDEWRTGWIAQGMPWSSKNVPEPAGWNPFVQLGEGLVETNRAWAAVERKVCRIAKAICPVCAFDGGTGVRGDGEADLVGDACPSCGFCLGYHDDVCGIGFDEWRRGWITRAAPWCGEASLRPTGWCPAVQLSRLSPIYLLWACPSGLFDATTAPER